MNDWQLLDAYVTRGSETAFSDIVTKYMPMVYASALRRAGPGLADDITQGVFMILANKSTHLQKKHRGTMAGWLFRTTRFTAFEAIRTQQRRIAREQQHEQETTEPSGPIEEVAWREIRPLLDKALDTLTPRDRDAVIMRYVQGTGYAEVASSLGISENAATKRVERAITKLRSFFDRRQIVVGLPVLTAILSSRATEAVAAELVRCCVAAAISARATGVVTGLSAAAMKAMALAQAKAIAAISCAAVSAGVLTIGATTFALNVVSATQAPFDVTAIHPMTLCYEGHAILPDGTRAFQVNFRDGHETHIVRDGDSFEGFTVRGHTPLYVKQIIPGIGGTGTVDVSELVVANDDEEIVLVRGHPSPTREAVAVVTFMDGASNAAVRVGDRFSTPAGDFVAVDLDREARQLVVRRLRDGREFHKRITHKQSGGNTP